MIRRRHALSFWFTEDLHWFSTGGAGFSCLKRLLLDDGQPFHEPPKFLLRQQFQLLLVSRPLKSLLYQSLVQQHVSRAIPVQRFDPIRSPSTKQKDGGLIQLLLELQFNHGHQPVDLLAHVGVPAGNVIVSHPAEVKHGDSTLSPARLLLPCCSRQVR